MSGGGTATLANGTYCFHNVTVSGGSTLIINGPVMMNVTGKFTDSGGSLQNTSYIPANLQVTSSYTGSNGVTVSGTSATYIMHLCSGHRPYGLGRRAALRLAGRQDAHSLWKLADSPRPGLAMLAVAGFRANTNPIKIGPAQAGPFSTSISSAEAGASPAWSERASVTAEQRQGCPSLRILRRAGTKRREKRVRDQKSESLINHR